MGLTFNSIGHGGGQAGRTNQGRKGPKVGLCKELEGNDFDYAVYNPADLMRTNQNKLHQNMGTKLSKNILNKQKRLSQYTSRILPIIY